MNKYIQMKTIRLSIFLLLKTILLLAQQTKLETIKDSLNIISLEEVLLTGIRANEDSPVTLLMSPAKTLSQET